MEVGLRTQIFKLNESAPLSPNQAASPVNGRNLTKNHLGGIIFGCKNSTIKECLFKQLFGLPAQHFTYVKNIDPGLPLFLFNYSDRKLHGIFEAASSGQMNINPYAWTVDGSQRTPYPAQVQICVRLQCHPLPEEQFKPIIVDNYYNQSHFWFELDHAQASKLMSLLSSLAVAPGTCAPHNTAKWRTLFQALPSHDKIEEIEVLKPMVSKVDFSYSLNSNGVGSSDVTCLDANSHPLENQLGKHVLENGEKDLIYKKLKELALDRECSNPQLRGMEDIAAANNVHSGSEGFLEKQINSEECNEIHVDSFDYPSVITQLMQGMEELKAFKTEQIHKTGILEQKLVEAETEIQQLKHKCMAFESMLHPSMVHVDETTIVESLDDLELDLDEVIFLVGGYDGISWLSALDSFSPAHDVIKSLQPMNSVRSYASVARLNGELYIFGGGNGTLWFDTVESYDPANNKWTMRPSLNVKKGSLAGVTLNNKIFAIGGGNGADCFSEVEMFDSDVGHWISTRSMLQKRFALAAAELNGAIYAVGGYNGKDYLKSAERFDPREHSWTSIQSMNTKRGCHSMVVLNEKLYAIGGYDGNAMVPSVEIFDPRIGSWTTGESMDQSRGYSAAVVFKESIYAIGGVRTGDTIVDKVEHYEEGRGWQVTNLRAIGKRCFSSAFVL